LKDEVLILEQVKLDKGLRNMRIV